LIAHLERRQFFLRNQAINRELIDVEIAGDLLDG